MRQGKTLFLTGGTGLIGKALLARLVHAPAYQKIYLLLRPSGNVDVGSRLEDLLRKVAGGDGAEDFSGRVHAVAGDLSLPGLGLSLSDRQRLGSEVEQILHCGASTDFSTTLEDSRKHNVDGTRHVLELAMEWRRQGRLRRYDHVSTAYVLGGVRGVVDEASLAYELRFANPYEQSKYEAEQLVREQALGLPTAIHRPSIVVGDSRHGFTPHFKVLYWPLQLLARNLVNFFPCQRQARLDVVPVDFVADAILALMQDSRALGGTWLLTAGLGQELKVRALLRDAEAIAGIKARPTLPFWMFFALWRSPLAKLFPVHLWEAMRMALPYRAYLEGHGAQFDASKTHALLAEHGVVCPSWDSYKHKVLSYCTQSRWGRRPPRPESYYYQHAHTAL